MSKPDEAWAAPTADQRAAIEAVARRLHELREGWLNPPDVSEAELAKRTLTDLYNLRPSWLVQIHQQLDWAVLDAYGWSHDISDVELLGKLLQVNLERPPASVSTPDDTLQL